MNRKAIADSQKEILSNIFVEGEKLVSKPNPILSEIKDAKMSFGSWGDHLQSFLRSIDISHPDVGEILSSNDISYVRQAILLSQFIINSGSTFTEDFRERLSRLIPSDVRDNVRSLNGRHVRLISDAKLRQAARAEKSIKKINMEPVYGKGQIKGWVNSFRIYGRFSQVAKEEIEQAQKLSAHYKKLGLVDMCGDIDKSVEAVMSFKEEEFCGFRCIKIAHSAVILAKMHEYGFGSDARITVSNADLGPAPSSYGSPYPYTPMVVPFTQLEDIASVEVKSVINHLENMPEVGGRPMFDHYLAIIPEINESRTISEIKNNIQRERIVPIILGERSGKCYFICYMV